jgi:hypothetical protein
MIKRIAIGAVGMYLLFAIIGRFVEEMGAAQCGCRPDCWCQRRGLSTFRWVFPFRHSMWPTEVAEEKEALAKLT